MGARGTDTVPGCSRDATDGCDSPERSWPVSSGLKSYSGCMETCSARGFKEHYCVLWLTGISYATGSYAARERATITLDVEA